MDNIHCTINGKPVSFSAAGIKRLLDVLREDFGLTGAKEGCGEGECGACSVLINGKLVNSCLVPAAAVHKADIITIEGLRESKRGECIIEAFADTGAVQCGFCTPGMVMAAEAVLEKNPDPQEDEIRLGISGNLCRCTGYDRIVQAIQLASEKGKGLW